jgi:hypothetical protein
MASAVNDHPVPAEFPIVQKLAVIRKKILTATKGLLKKVEKVVDHPASKEKKIWPPCGPDHNSFCF